MEEPIVLPDIKYIPLPKKDEAPNTYNRNTKVLIENGVLDHLTTADDYAAFKKELMPQDIDFQFHE